MTPAAPPPLLLGAIADDFTGATDLANTLVRAGMRTVQTIGVPPAGYDVAADAIVVALKSRTKPAAEAVADSMAALAWLRARGARQVYFKYCSTFDSTDAGNIGPVADALQDALGAPLTIVCPAFPANGRTVYMGHLFVGDRLLSESSMRDHPLTPMRDSDLVRVMGRQTRRHVALVPYAVVTPGPARSSAAGAAARRRCPLRRRRCAARPAIFCRHRRRVPRSGADHRGSGVAMGLPRTSGARTAAARGRRRRVAGSGPRRGARGQLLGGDAATGARHGGNRARGGIDPLKGSRPAAGSQARARRSASTTSGPGDGADLFERRAGGRSRSAQRAGQGGIGGAGRVRRSPPSRRHWSRRACDGSSSPAAKRGCSGRSVGRHRAGDRSADRSRRAVDR